MATLTIDDVQKRYPNGFHAIVDMNLAADDGEFLILVGPSGCGKSTLLRMVAGLEEISAGEVRIGDRVVNHLSPKDRDIAMVFQNYALYPHMTVADNMGFALKLAKFPKQEIAERVKRASDILGLTEQLEKKPKQLSGGQRQRVAMGRAIVRAPNLFLMDEPLSNLDAKLRVQMRAEIAQLQRELGVTTVYVTHDQVEAMTMGDKVAVLNAGRLMQAASPEILYEQPNNLFVATFMGSPSMNVVEAEIHKEGDDLVAVFGKNRLTIPPASIERYPLIPGKAGARVVLGIRPEHFEVARGDEPDGRTIRANTTLVEALGNELVVHLDLKARPVITEDFKAALDSDDILAELEREAEKGIVSLTARMDPDRRPAEGAATDLVVETAKLHFFDLKSGDALR